MEYTPRHDHDLENKICEMSTYLDRLVTVGESQNKSNISSIAENAQAPRDQGFLNSGPPVFIPPGPLNNAFNFHSTMNPMQIAPAYHLSNVTSALASRMNAPNSNLRFIRPVPRQRSEKWTSNKQVENEPDSSDIDVDATMAELGQTPESLTNNEVYRLFSCYKKIAFYTNASYIFEDIYEAKTLPNTMNASFQTRHAVWSSNRLLRQLRETLKKYTHVPGEYQIPLTQCKQALEELQIAIQKLEHFKYCDLEHRKGKFVTPEGRENFQSLIEAFNEVIECIGKSRMYVEVLTWAVTKPCVQVNEDAAGVSCSGPSHPAVMEEALEHSIKGRPLPARRYIG